MAQRPKDDLVVGAAVKMENGEVKSGQPEYTDNAIDLVVEKFTLSGRNLFANVMLIKFSPYSSITDEHHHESTLTFAQMQADIRDVAFYFRMETGLEIIDSGLADVVLGGEGLSVSFHCLFCCGLMLIRLLPATIHLVSSDQNKCSVFKVKVVIVKVHTLKFYSKHNFFYKTFKPLATCLIKKQIKKAIKDLITTGMEYVDGQLVGVRDRMASAKATEGESRTKVLQDVRIAPFCSCLNRFRFADAVHLFYIDVQEKGRDFHTVYHR